MNTPRRPDPSRARIRAFNHSDAAHETPASAFDASDIRYRSLFEHVPIGLYITTADGLIVDANPALIDMLGYPNKQSLLGVKASDLYLDPKDRDLERTLFGRERVVRDYETRLRRRDGREIWVRDTFSVVRDEHGDVLFYEGTLQDVTDERRTQEELVYLATHDPLTGVYNRHSLREILDRETVRARRYRHPIGVLMIDINRFKEVNDRFGHALGDRVLETVADILNRSVRESDIVVRYGGDEFLVLLLETDGETETVRARMLHEMSQRMGVAPLLDLPITLAIGAAHWMPEGTSSIEAALMEADAAMYAVKRGA